MGRQQTDKQVTERRPDFKKYDRVYPNPVKRKAKRNYWDDDDDPEYEGFYIVEVAPYKAAGVWHMVVKDDNEQPSKAKEVEVKCKDFHLVGQRKVSEPIMKKETKEKLMKFTKPAIIVGVVLLGLFAIVGWFVGNFNSLVAMNEDVDNSWAKVETQYQRRFDLIGNLVESVKGSQAQELSVIKEIADGRKTYAAAQASGDENGQAEAATKIETNVANLPKLLQEAYPELTSNQNVQNLMKELQGTENDIAGVRDTYNDTVTNYNKGVMSVPKVFFANMFGYKERAQFKANAAAAEAPKVDFSKPEAKKE